MKRYDHLIVGGGVAGYAAAEAIREVDSAASIGMLSEEPEGPYDRSALSKDLWRGAREEDVRLDLGAIGVDLISHRATAIDAHRRTVLTGGGGEFGYGRLLLAPGVEPRFLPFELDSVHYLHSLRQYRRLRERADEGRSFLVVGGGWLGTELAATLATAGNEVTMAFQESGIGGNVFPPYLAAHLTAYFRAREVDVRPRHKVRFLGRAKGDRTVVVLSGDKRLEVDEVVVAVGSVPRIELAWTAGLGTADGIVVDELFRTRVPAIFAAGDVVSYPDVVMGRRRVENADHARQSGWHAGLAMAGEGRPYRHLPRFWSGFFDHAYEAVGALSPDLRTVADWDEPFEKGVIRYLDEASRVRGVLAWNTSGLMDEARDLLSMGTLPLERRGGTGPHPVTTVTRPHPASASRA